MTAVSFIRLAILATLLIASAARAEDSTVAGTKVAPEMSGERQLELTHWRGTNAVKVDGDDSQTVGYRSFGAQLHYAPRVYSVDLAGSNLLRDVEDERQSGQTDKATTIVTPAFGLNVGERLTVQLAYSDIRTHVENTLAGDSYELDADRQALTVGYKGDGSTLTVTYATEARAEKDYKVGDLALLGYEYEATDRDYVPAQLDVAYVRRIFQPLQLNGKVRYSHYNDDVYKDTYDTAVPKTPTVGQVFDYLLSFDVGAAYDLTPSVALVTAFDRKAALDTNSYTGDEYLVGTGATIGTKARFSDAATVSASATTATGKKTHEVDGTSYDYANRLTRFEASVALAM